MYIKFVVEQQYDGFKLGACLREKYGFSTTLIRRIKACDGASINGEPRHMGNFVKANDLVVISTPEKDTSEKPYELGFEPIYMDDYLYAINKPAGICMYRMYPEDDANIIAGVLAMNERLGIDDGPIRPLSRLDRDTTGIILFARFPHVQHHLQMLHGYSKEYLLITDGLPPEDYGTIDLPIGKHDEKSFRMTCMPEGKPALTEYRVLDKCGDHALVLAKLHTGRTHQIRVHFLTIGCPLHGDSLYHVASPEIRGQSLHCHRVTLKHPVTGLDVSIRAELPPEFQVALQVCGLHLPSHIEQI